MYLILLNDYHVEKDQSCHTVVFRTIRRSIFIIKVPNISEGQGFSRRGQQTDSIRAQLVSHSSNGRTAEIPAESTHTFLLTHFTCQ